MTDAIATAIATAIGLGQEAEDEPMVPARGKQRGTKPSKAAKAAKKAHREQKARDAEDSDSVSEYGTPAAQVSASASSTAPAPAPADPAVRSRALLTETAQMASARAKRAARPADMHPLPTGHVPFTETRLKQLAKRAGIPTMSEDTLHHINHRYNEQLQRLGASARIICRGAHRKRITEAMVDEAASHAIGQTMLGVSGQ